jgi:hypothetical protein
MPPSGPIRVRRSSNHRTAVHSCACRTRFVSRSTRLHFHVQSSDFISTLRVWSHGMIIFPLMTSCACALASLGVCGARTSHHRGGGVYTDAGGALHDSQLLHHRSHRPRCVHATRHLRRGCSALASRPAAEKQTQQHRAVACVEGNHQGANQYERESLIQSRGVGSRIYRLTRWGGLLRQIHASRHAALDHGYRV